MVFGSISAGLQEVNCGGSLIVMSLHDMQHYNCFC
jgi:hypothetical protein